MTTTLETGCYVDSHHGIYAMQRVCEIAQGYGWQGLVPTDDDCQNTEYAVELSDEALDYLNGNVAEDGYIFDWWEGNVMYWSVQEWQEVYA